jgi:arylsulfatase A-like enzyme
MWISAVGVLGPTEPALVATSASPVSSASARPNVLVIVTDDQRVDMLTVMDDTREIFGSGGVSFTNGYANTPLCCPARASIFSGRYAHNHGVRENGLPVGFDHQTTIQRYLHDAGYITGVVGKFFNGWSYKVDPPHFDRWAITGSKSYTDATYNLNGEAVPVTEYSTDYIADRAVGFLQEFESDDATPWFLHVGSIAPHLPASVEPDYATAPVPAWDWRPSAFEEDLSDKPPFVQGGGPAPTAERYVADDVQRALLSVDDLVQRVFGALEAQGEAADTLAFFVSDNGFQWVEHGLWGKDLPYDESVRIPFLARWPGVLGEGVVDARPVALLDMAPTIMDAAGLTPDPTTPMDGVSLLRPSPRTHVLTEAWPDDGPPIWASIRGPAFSYVEYYADDEQSVVFREFYDLDDDPWQLDNALADAQTAGDPDVPALHDLLVTARSCAGSACEQGMASAFANVDDPAIAEDTADAEAVFTVSLSHPEKEAVEVPFSTVDGSAMAPADYRSLSGTLRFPAGQTTRRIRVALRDDALDEADEKFFLDLSSATNAVVVDSRGETTIGDDDPEPAVAIQDVAVVEGTDTSTTASFVASLSSISGRDVTLEYVTTDDSAVAPGDYTALSGTVTIPPGGSTAEILVPVSADPMDEDDETFSLQITEATGAIVADGQGLGTILDDDPEPSVSIGDVSTVEGNGGTVKIFLPVTLSHPSSRTVTVAYATANWTARAGRDYVAASGSLSFSPGQTSKSLAIRVYGDTVPEPEEQFLVDLSAPVWAVVADGQALVTIIDDDTTP